MKTDLVILNEENVKEKLYYIRGKQVMLDSDLAKIYGYTTKAFNQQVQRNIDKFDEDFMFQLTKEEYYKILRSQNVTLELEQGKYSKYLPYAFTEEGVYMLMTVLKGELAVKQSKSLIRIFKSMKEYIINNDIIEQKFINKMVIDHEKDIKLLQESFKDFNEERKIKNTLFLDGEEYDSISKIIDILNESKSNITIIDNYIDKSVLDLIKDIDKNIIIVTKSINRELLNKYNKQYKNITIKYNNSFHDRFIIIDNNKVYHLGTSLNHIGKKLFYISLIEDTDIIKLLLDKIKNIIN